jgi:adenine-specific DNA-methyltransferase
LKFIVEFPEKERVFESVTQATTIFLFKNGLLGETFKLSVGLNKATLPPESSALLSWDRVEALFGKNLTLPLVKSTIEVELMEKIKQDSTPLELIAKIYQGDINLTFESERLSNVETANLLIRGDHISSYLVDLSAKNADRRWFKAKKDTLISEEYRIVCQQVANMGLKKRLNVGIVPPKVIVANSANCIEIEDSDYTNAELTGLLNSTLMNWYFKKTSTNNHVNVYELNTLPIKKFGGKRINEFSDLVLKRIQITEGNIGRNGISIDCLQVEEAIDNMIYELYGLTTEEILVVKQS